MRNWLEPGGVLKRTMWWPSGQVRTGNPVTDASYILWGSGWGSSMTSSCIDHPPCSRCSVVAQTRWLPWSSSPFIYTCWRGLVFWSHSWGAGVCVCGLTNVVAHIQPRRCRYRRNGAPWPALWLSAATRQTCCSSTQKHQPGRSHSNLGHHHPLHHV
jgi:hypothetical protein